MNGAAGYRRARAEIVEISWLHVQYELLLREFWKNYLTLSLR
ncbi:MAG: hypothetical protein AAGI88_26085 [Pseudomonadota bacterium]